VLGRVLTHYSNYYYVQLDQDAAVDDERPLIQCFVRALLKKAGHTVLVGDRVTVQLEDNAQTGWITGIEPRSNQLSRPKIANITQVLVMHPVHPSGQIEDLLALDRLLLHIGLTGLPVLLVLSKADLIVDPQVLTDWRHLYGQTLGYHALHTSIKKADQLQELALALAGHTTVLAGVSGAGKSSLLNALMPGWQLQTAEKLTEHGQHTTRNVQLLALNANPVVGEPGFDDHATYTHALETKDSWVADTPGFRLLAFDKTEPATLARKLPEAEQAAKLGLTCGFADCLHMDESECVVRDRVHALRYQHYRHFQVEATQYRQTVIETSQKQEDGGSKRLDRAGKQQVAIVRLSGRNRQASRRQMRQATPDDDMQDEDTNAQDIDEAQWQQDCYGADAADELNTPPDEN
jgi:ribosome biogenesis GTPase / thiamine phosphate phosphatase